MAWTCKKCDARIEQDTVLKCSSCGESKRSWTMVGGETRQFHVTTRTKALALYRGEDAEPGPGDASYEGVAVVKTQHAVAVPKTLAAAWHAEGLLPPPEQVLFARLMPGAIQDPDLSTHLTVLFDTEAVEEVTHPAPEGSALSEAGHHDARYLFVYGPQELDPQLQFAGLVVVDVSEESETGHAPTVGVRALRRKRVDLPLQTRAAQVERLACAKIRFNTDSAIFMPDGLAVLCAVLELVRRDPERRVLIASHTDTQGSAESNLDLSRARSQNVLHLLMGEKREWASACLERDNSHLDQDVREILAWAAEVWNWKCAPGAIDNTPPPDEAVVAFKQAFRAKFSSNHTPVDYTAEIDLGFWRRVQNLYGWTLLESLLLDDRAELGALCAQLQWVDPELRAIGCGERYPLKATGDGVAEKENRRTEFLFFDAENAPAAGGDEAALQSVYADGTTFVDLDCPEPKFFDLPLPQGNVVFVIDFSGSMSPTDREGKQTKADRVGYAKRNLAKAIRDLDAETRFGLVAYNSRIYRLWEERVGESPYPALREASPANKAEAIAWLNRGRAQSQTASSRALEQAFGARGAGEGPSKVVFLTDGLPTPRQRGTSVAAEQAQIAEEVEGYSGWDLDVIGFFAPGAETGALADFLTKLAESKGGTHKPITVRTRGR